MLLQLRRAAERAAADLLAGLIAGATGATGAAGGDDPRHELRRDLHHQLPLGALRVLERAWVEADQGPARCNPQRLQGRHRECMARQAVNGDDQVRAAGDELVGGAESWHRPPDVEGVGVADGMVRVAADELPGQLRPGEEIGGAAPEE